MTDIRRRALTAFALNRTPGLHFIGNFLGVKFVENTPQRVRVSLDTGPYCEDSDGQLDVSVISLLADIALASVVRANLNPAQRLATVSLQLQFTGEPMVGSLEGIGSSAGFLQGAYGQQGLSRATVQANGRTALLATGAFMVLDPPPGVTMHPPVSADHAARDPLPEAALTRAEAAILARIDAADTDAHSAQGFLQRLWGQAPQATRDGAVCRVDNAPHAGNRVGHMQGGLQIGLAATTANAALPARWMLAGLTACFVSPGEGRTLRATSRVVHRGRQTAVVQTTITGKLRRRVLEVLSTHAWRGDPT
jgi:acyl-coenzyme A thioesterase PaaI-like protein